MEIVHKIIFVIILLSSIEISYSQCEKKFCKAVESANFNKVERIIKRVIRKHKHGQTYFNGEESGYQITLVSSFDSITKWLDKQPCIETSFWDKCQSKPCIYPGWTTIGVVFKTKNGSVERCFTLENGTTGQVNILGWRPKIFKSKIKIIYKKMTECEGFIEIQKANCIKK